MKWGRVDTYGRRLCKPWWAMDVILDVIEDGGMVRSRTRNSTPRFGGAIAGQWSFIRIISFSLYLHRCEAGVESNTKTPRPLPR